MAEQLTYEKLKEAVAGRAAAFRSRTTLQPAGGPGDKVFPPTYSGGQYATENRRIQYEDENGQMTEQVLPCVLLDSVQSQANRMELSLLDAWERDEASLPVIVVDFKQSDRVNQNNELDEIGRNWRITSLEAPHRIADAILRDSVLVDGDDAGKPFSKSTYADYWRAARLHNATPLFKLCPSALVFGTWGSPEKPGGLGAKFQRAIVSEIVGVNAEFGRRTSSRVDPLGIRRAAGPVYRTPEGSWTLDPDKALDEQNKSGNPTGKKLLFSKNRQGNDVAHDPQSNKLPDEGTPSVVNHGNYPPSFAKYGQNVEGPNPLREFAVEVDYHLRGSDGQITSHNQIRSADTQARENQVAPGGVTMSYALQATTLSLAALRRLRFPLDKQKRSDKQVDDAARTALAAMGLCAAALAREWGGDLRSRCQLHPVEPIEWELLDKPGADGARFELSAEQALSLFDDAVKAARKAGLPWLTDGLSLKPSDELVELVRKSQELETGLGEEESE